MSVREIIELSSAFFIAAFGYIKWWHEIREKNRERKDKDRERIEKEKAQKELAEIRRRAEAPFLCLSDARFNMLYHDAGNGKLEGISCMDKCTLRAMQTEVKEGAEDGDEVVLVVENIGQAARSVKLKLEGESISFRQEAEMQHAGGHQYIMYPYRKSKHGQEQELTVLFESGSGVQGTHIYATRHGMRFLRRMDPPLP